MRKYLFHYTRVGFCLGTFRGRKTPTSYILRSLFHANLNEHIWNPNATFEFECWKSTPSRAGANLNARNALFKLNDTNTESFDRKVKSNDKRINLNCNFHGTTESGEFE